MYRIRNQKICVVDEVQYRKAARAPGGKIQDFFFWLRGLWAPQYVPFRSRYGDRKGKTIYALLPVKISTERERWYIDE